MNSVKEIKCILVATIYVVSAFIAEATTHGSWDSTSPSSTTVQEGGFVTVNGWGVDTQMSGPASNFVANVYCDGNFMVQVPMTVHRPDVGGIWSGWDYAGFSATFSTAGLLSNPNVAETFPIEIWVGGGPSGWVNLTSSVIQGHGNITVTPAPNPPTGSISSPSETQPITSWGGTYTFAEGSGVDTHGWKVVHDGSVLGTNFSQNSTSLTWGYGSGEGTYIFSVNMSGPGGGAETNTITTVTKKPKLNVDQFNGSAMGPNHWIRQGDNLNASGWAFDYQNGAPLQTKIYMDAIHHGDVNNGEVRTDVTSFYAGQNEFRTADVDLSGWSMNWDTTNTPVGSRGFTFISLNSFGYQTYASTPSTIDIRSDPTVNIQILDDSQTIIPLDGNGRAPVALGEDFYIRVNGSDAGGNLGKVYSRVENATSTQTYHADQPVSGSNAHYDFGPYTADELGVWNVWGHAANYYAGNYASNAPGWSDTDSPDIEVVMVLADTDNDGMPDPWETTHGLNPNSPSDALLDADSDGWSNVAEYNRESDPNVYNQGTSAIGNAIPGGWVLTDANPTKAVGSTTGQLSVAPSGALTYSIPFWTTPGTAGMDPKISLNYSSQAGAGISGFGWSLGGISAITRGPQTLAVDGASRGVTLTSSDRFYLDGQRLIKIGGGGVEYGSANSEYRTEIDSITKILAQSSAGSGPAWFKVWTKAGLIIEYGNSADSAFEAEGKLEKHHWRVNKITDTAGNYMVFQYAGTAASGPHRVTRINYTGNGSVTPYASLRFEYENRPDWTEGYVAGSMISNRHRLTHVKSYYGESVARTYTLGYSEEVVNGRSLLTSLTETGENGKSYPAMDFDYEDNTLGWSQLSSAFHPPELLADNAANNGNGWPTGTGSGFVDLDADGRVDFVNAFDTSTGAWLNTTSGWVANTNYELNLPLAVSSSSVNVSGGRFADVNSDGYVDYIYHKVGSNGILQHSEAYINQGASGQGWDSTQTQWKVPAPIGRDGTQNYDQRRGGKFLDINGDGRVDFVTHMTTGTGIANLAVYLNTGNGWAYNPGYSSMSQDLGRYGARFVDLNGDGLPDIACYYKSGWTTKRYSWLNTGTGWAYTPRFNVPQRIFISDSTLPGVEFSDVNGDGLPDFIWYREYSSGGYTRGAALNSGANSGSSSGSAWIQNSAITAAYAPTVPLSRDNSSSSGSARIDLNADGIPDSALSRYFSTSDNAVQTSYGTLRAPFSGTGHDLPSYLLKFGEKQMGVDFIDIDADGAIDILWHRKLSNGSIEKAAYRNLSNPIQGRLKKVTNGFGVAVDVKYAALTEAGVYTKAANNADLSDDMTQAERDEVVNLAGPMYVVREVINDDGAGGEHKLTYSYANLRANRERGNLGFGYMKVHDEVRGLRTHTTFRQDYPFIGQAKYTKVTNGNDTTLLTESTVSWSEKSLNSGATNFVYASSVVDKSYDLDTSNLYLTSTTTTGAPSDYGDVLNISVATSDGFTKTTTNTFETPDTTNWVLGRLSAAQVVSQDGSATIQRNSSFTYHPSTGLLWTETVEPKFTAGEFTPDEYTLTTTYLYDSFGNKTSVEVSGVDLTVDNNGNYTTGSIVKRTTTTQYDSNGRFPIWTKNAKDHQEDYTGYDQLLGVLTQMRGANDLETDWSHDGFGRQVLEVRSDDTQTITTYVWTPGGSLSGSLYFVETESTGAAPSRTHYDKFGRALWSQSINGTGKIVLQKTSYDALGRVASTTMPYFNDGSSVYATSTFYDLLDRPKTVITPDDAVADQTITFNYSGFVGTAIDPKSRKTETIKNSQGWVTSNIRNKDAGSSANDYSAVTFAYDPLGNLTGTVAAGVTTALTYDKRGRKTSMVDPDMGTWLYRYNVFGELIWQKDAENRIVTMSYDGLGRMVSRTETEGTTTWTYDSSPTKGTGKLHTVTSPGGYIESHIYDNLGRPAQVSRTIDGTAYTYATGYDGAGRPNRVTYPATGLSSNPFAVRQVYNEFGFLKEIRHWKDSDTDPSSSPSNIDKTITNPTGHVYWMADSFHVSGRVDGESYGNGTANDRAYSAATGRLLQASVDRASVVGPSFEIQNLTYYYDSVGNVKRRHDSAPGVNRNERFYTGTTGDGTNDGDGYDGLDRLLVHRVDGGTAVTVAYNQKGNITSKSDVGSYTYHAGKPHAVWEAGMNTLANNRQYNYDNNGNMTNGGGRTIQWTSFNQMRVVSDNSTNKVSEFSFGASRERVKHVRKQGTTVVDTTIYAGSLYQRVSTAANGLVEHKHYVMAPTGRIAVYTDRSDFSKDTRYFHTDGLGSITAVTSEDGTVLKRYAYDAWGKQSTLFTNSGSGITNQAPSTRGFTDHEMLSDQGLIHMNGRVYDPVLGRFLSADPFVDGAADAQGYNRFSYVANNPLGATDPSGYFSLKSLFKIVAVVVATVVSGGAALAALGAGTGGLWGGISAFATGSFGGLGNAIIAGAAAGFGSGFSSSLLNGGSLGDAFKAGLIGGVVGGIAAGITFGIGSLADDLGYWGTSIAHGAAQGGLTEAFGGEFRHGFYAAFSSSALGGHIDGIGAGESWGSPARVVASAVVGGTASAVGGGKFANGAVSGAFIRMFNEEAHPRRNPSRWQKYTVSPDKDGTYRIRNSKGRFVTDQEYSKALKSKANVELSIDNSITSGRNVKIVANGLPAALNLTNSVFDRIGVDYQFILPMTSPVDSMLAVLEVGSMPELYNIVGYQARLRAALNETDPRKMLLQLEKSNIEHLNEAYLRSLKKK